MCPKVSNIRQKVTKSGPKATKKWPWGHFGRPKGDHRTHFWKKLLPANQCHPIMTKKGGPWGVQGAKMAPQNGDLSSKNTVEIQTRKRVVIWCGLGSLRPWKTGFSWEGMHGLAFHLFQFSSDFWLIFVSKKAPFRDILGAKMRQKKEEGKRTNKEGPFFWKRRLPGGHATLWANYFFGGVLSLDLKI